MGRALIAVAAAILGLSAIASPALAQTFTPTNTFADLTGRLSIDQGVIVDCDVKVRYFIDASGYAHPLGVTISDPFNPWCGMIIQPTGIWTIQPVNAFNPYVTLYVGLNTISGSCSGYLFLPYNNAMGEVTFNYQYLFGTPGNCILDGVLAMDPTLTIVP